MSNIKRFNRSSLLAEGEQVSQEQLVEEAKLLAFERSVARLNRRSFLGTLGAASAAAGTVSLGGALIGCSASGTTTTIGTVTASTPSVTDVLNFALNLEYLEASFYLYVTTGSGLTTADMGTSPGTVTGGAKVSFVNTTVASVAAQLATDEREHVEFLRTTIASAGGTPVSMPNLNLAAAGTVTTDAQFLTAARQLETVGISAYAGGAQYLTTSAASLSYAAQILDTEAQHEGFLRQLCINLGVTSPAVDSQDIPPTSSAVFNTNANGLNAVRTTSQVLQIVYASVGSTGVTKGGFFPSGLNGNIVSS